MLRKGPLKAAAEALFEEASIAYKCGFLEDALASWKNARAIYAKLDFIPKAATCDFQIGITHRLLGHPEQAITHYKTAREIFLKLDSDEKVAYCDNNMGNAFADLFQREQAIECFEQAKSVFLRLRSDENVAHCELNIGALLNDLFQSREAISHHEKAKEIFLRLGSKKNIADCDFNIGVSLQSFGHSQQAIECFDQAKVVFLELGLAKMIAACEMGIGVSLRTLGQPRRAVEHFDKARNLFLQNGLLKELTDCEVNLANALQDLDQVGPAIEHFQKAKVFYLERDLQKDVADCELNIGALSYKSGRPNQAITYLERARVVFLYLALDKQVADCEFNLGTTLIAIKQMEKGIRHLEQAKDSYVHLGLERDAAECDIHIGVATLHLSTTDDTQKIRDLCEKALDHLNTAIQVIECSRAEITITAYRVTFLDKYIDAYMTAITCCLRLGMTLAALNYLERSRSKVLAEIVSGNLLPDPNEIDKDLYDKFLNVRAQLIELGLLPIVKGEQIARADVKHTGTERKMAQQEFDAIAQRIAREFPDSAYARRFAATEVQYLKEVDEYIDLLPDSRSCLLEFLTWADDERLRAFLVTKQNKVELLVFPDRTVERINEVWQQWKRMYVDGLRPDKGMAIVSETCQQLYDLIFDARVEVIRENEEGLPHQDSHRNRLLDYLNTTLEPADETHVRRMYLVPHAQLFFMPLHAACGPDYSIQSAEITKATSQCGLGETTQTNQELVLHPHYLLEDYVVIYAPSAYLLKASQGRRYIRPAQPNALVVGNPQPHPRPLPGARAEAEDVTRRLLNAGWKVDMLVEEKATKQSYLSGDGHGVAGINSGAYHHQHLALHGDFGTYAKEAGLYFGQSSEDSVCHASNILGAPLQNTNTVIAASCFSATTDFTERTINEYLGMGAAFLKAGVGTFIGTLYSLSDEGSQKVMSELYRLHLENGLSWVDALRQAQLGQLRMVLSPTGTAKNSLDDLHAQNHSAGTMADQLAHPYYWAAFTVSGKE